MMSAELKADVDRIAVALDELVVVRAREARRVAPAPYLPPTSWFVVGCIDMARGVERASDDPEAYKLGRELGWLFQRAWRASQ